MSVTSSVARALGFGLASLLLWSAAGARAAPPRSPLQMHPERVSKNMLGADTRGGQLVAQQDAAGWRVMMGKRTVLDGAPMGITRLRLATVAVGRNADLAVVIMNTGTGCPLRFAVISVDAAGRAAASQPFGTCADLLSLGVDGNALVFTMAEHFGDETAGKVQFRYVEAAVSGPLSP